MDSFVLGMNQGGCQMTQSAHKSIIAIGFINMYPLQFLTEKSSTGERSTP